MHTSNGSEDDSLVGAEILFGPKLIGHVEGVVRDPLSGRVRKLITTYGPRQRRVAVPMEWVVQRTPSRLVLGVGSLSLDDLAEQAGARHVASAAA
jgi:PRC-barrel domain